MSDVLASASSDELGLARAGQPAPGALAGPLHALGHFCRTQRIGLASLIVVVMLAAIAIAAPAVAPYSKDQAFSVKNPHYDPTSFDPASFSPTTALILAGPSRAHPLGTDNLGRDLLTRVVLGARLSLSVGITASVIATAAGTLVGLLSGYFGGLIDLIAQRIVDAMIAIPALVFLLLLVQVSQPSMTVTIAALAALGTFGSARVVRSAVFAVRAESYVEAARSIGAGHGRTMRAHVLPNVVAPVLVLFSVAIGANILAEAGLSFLNLGVPGPSWGQMVSQGRGFLEQKPLMSIVGGVAITVTVLAFNLLGDALRDELDPRMRGQA